ncbi:fibroblast growth factor-binding protein 1-like [Erinaceus europaeus]|uniref:Fibroblast growth factor-binding protein 1-like n=1 Tax=Erinaceus europaeus TaxID=9365 RepID=A0A1S2ZE01_ERIEU|nr:fibroblast growth factor-binding protein 1-like [Erinaceus europaeus]XP_060044288.1 fibroblast growth factor-binding protein 1-like [Erinaceus europaeus]
MKLCCATLLSLLLLAAHVLLVEGRKEAKHRQASKNTKEGKRTWDQSQKEQRNLSPKLPTKGKFVTPDQADCRWEVTEQEQGISLKVECTRQDTKFSCVFTGNPTSCLELHSKNMYWKQIGRNLRSQKVLCRDSNSVLKARVCRKKFPESNLKLVSSTLISSKQSESSPKEQNHVKDTTSPGPTESRPVGTNSPECVEDPDLVNQKRVAVEYCGETWGSFCKFFITMIQGSTCQ